MGVIGGFFKLIPKGFSCGFRPRNFAPDKKREYFGVKKEWVDGFELIPIIDVGIPWGTRVPVWPVDNPP